MKQWWAGVNTRINAENDISKEYVGSKSIDVVSQPAAYPSVNITKNSFQR